MKELVYKHIKENFIIYFLLIVVLMIGISAGAITIHVLSDEQNENLINFLDSFFNVLSEEKIENFTLLKHSFINNLQTAILIWILGITVIGLPITVIVVAIRGFILGFTVGFLINELGFKGFAFSIFALLPQNIFIIPGIIALSVLSITFSIKVITHKSRYGNFNFLTELTKYSISTVTLSILIIIGIFVEAYITPIFMKLLIGYIL